jgi:hypothetical protein
MNAPATKSKTIDKAFPTACSRVITFAKDPVDKADPATAGSPLARLVARRIKLCVAKCFYAAKPASVRFMLTFRPQSW